MLGFSALIISKKAAKGQRGRNGVALGQIAHLSRRVLGG